MEVLVQRLAGVFLEVGAGQLDLLGVGLVAFSHLDGDRAALHHRDLELADLVALGEIRVEVVLARKDAARRDVCADRQTKRDRPVDRTLVHHGQDARQCHVDGAGLAVGLGAKGGRGAGKDLANG